MWKKDWNKEVYELKVGSHKVSVVKGHIYHPGKWVMHCDPFFREEEIADDGVSPEVAQKIAVDLLKKTTREIAERFAEI